MESIIINPNNHNRSSLQILFNSLFFLKFCDTMDPSIIWLETLKNIDFASTIKRVIDVEVQTALPVV